MSLGQLEEQNKFRKSLSQYWVSKGITQIKIPQIGGQQLNLYKLYKSVCKKGGGQTVSQNKMWKEIVDQFGLPSTCTSASFTLKNHYQKYLLAYEQKYLFGKQDTAQVPQLVAGRNRKNMKDDLDFIGLPHKYPLSRNQGYQINTSTLSSELKKAYDKTDHNQKISYIKRTKMYPVISEVKHMMMAFQSPQHQQNIYAINILTLFSVNTQAPFLFSQYPFVVDSIAIYLERVYPTQNIQILQCIRNLTLAIRNLAINHKNLQPILESPLVQIFLKIFQQKSDKEITRNVLDIFSSLSKVGWDCKQLFFRMQGYLERDSYQDLETGIDLLRSLVQQKQQMCQNIIFDRIQFFSRLIIHTSIQIRVAILQIFAYLSDKSQRTRRCCLTNFKFMERIFAVMSPGDRYANKQSQLACYIVNNIAQSPCNYPLLRKFEKKLALVSFNSEILAPITTDILFKLSGRKEVRATHEQNSVLINVRNKINHRSESQDSSQYDD